MGKKYKKIWASKEEYDAHEARVDETLRRLREVAEKMLREGQSKRPTS